jgi:hypothetical protein
MAVDRLERDGTARTRAALAIVIVSLSVVSVALIAAVAIGFADATDRDDMARLVFTSMLPLLGTWVGTVLAFYFVRENLQAATESTLRLTGRLQPQTPVRAIMIAADRMTSYKLSSSDDVSAVKLHDIHNMMESAGFRRIPILDPSGAVLYVVHDSTLSRFASSRSKDPSDPVQFTEQMSDVLADATLRSLVEAFGVVGADAVLADARAAMRAIPNCNDVFVTETGQRAEPALGWLTNTDMAERQ